MRNEQESGVVLIAVFIILLPVIVIVSAFTSTMSSRTARLSDEVEQETALLAAESGIDLAIWAGRTGKLEDGVEFDYDLGVDTSCHIVPTWLKADGRDNDGDGLVDEDDEDVFQIVSTGAYRGTLRNIAAYLGPLPRVPLPLPGAVTVMNRNTTIDLGGSPTIQGYDTRMDGTAGDSAEDVAGLAVASPGTVADLAGELTASEGSKVLGVGGAPSLAVAPAPNLAEVVAYVQNTAKVVLTNSKYSSYTFGSGAAGTATIAYRDGDVEFAGGVQGAGILVVTGNLSITGNFRFDGIVIVLGNLDFASGTAQIFGGLIQGPDATMLDVRGTMDIRYSTEAVDLANSVSGNYVAFNGWQELKR